MSITHSTKERWYPAVNGTGKRPWFLTREIVPEGGEKYAHGKGFNLRRFKTQQSAQTAADKLNYQR